MGHQPLPCPETIAKQNESTDNKRFRYDTPYLQPKFVVENHSIPNTAHLSHTRECLEIVGTSRSCTSPLAGLGLVQQNHQCYPEQSNRMRACTPIKPPITYHLGSHRHGRASAIGRLVILKVTQRNLVIFTCVPFLYKVLAEHQP